MKYEIQAIPEFKGLINKFDPLKSPEGYLKSAINVDIDDAFNVRRRDGYTLHSSYTDITASYSTKNHQSAFIVYDSGILKNVSSNVVIDNGFTGSYFWDDSTGSTFIYGDRKGLIENDKFNDLYHPVSPHPALQVIAGHQPAGYYQIATAYRRISDGREGGMMAPLAVLIPNNSALQIKVEHLPGYEVTVYVSPVNGKYVYKWITTSDDTLIWDGPQETLSSPARDEQFGAQPIPENGNAVAFHQSRIYVAEHIPQDGKSVVWFSKPFSYHLFDQSKDYFVLNERVNCLIDIGTALVVGCENSIYYVKDGVPQRVANYGAPPGSPYDVTKDDKYFLWTNNGICYLNEFKNLTKEIFGFPASPFVNSAIIRNNGFERFVNLVSNATDSDNIFRS